MKKDIKKEVIELFKEGMFHGYLGIVFGIIALVKDAKLSLTISSSMLVCAALLLKYNKLKKSITDKNDLMVLLYEETRIRTKTFRNICISFFIAATISFILYLVYDIRIQYSIIYSLAMIVFFIVYLFFKKRENMQLVVNNGNTGCDSVSFVEKSNN